MREYYLSGFVLRRRNVGESDRIITFFSQEKGKVSFKAKGVRKSQAKLAGLLETNGLLRVRLVRGRGLDILIGVEVIESFALPEKLDVMLQQSAIIELIDALLPEEQPNELVSTLFMECRKGLAGSISPALVRQYFQLNILSATGSQPELSESTQAERYYLAYDSGTLGVARPHEHYGIIEPATLKLWRIMRNNSLATITKIGGLEVALKNGQKVLDRFYEYHFHVTLHSDTVLSD